jgi:Ca2+-binding RTX toxin-like protein
VIDDLKGADVTTYTMQVLISDGVINFEAGTFANTRAAGYVTLVNPTDAPIDLTIGPAFPDNVQNIVSNWTNVFWTAPRDFPNVTASLSYDGMPAEASGAIYGDWFSVISDNPANGLDGPLKIYSEIGYERANGDFAIGYISFKINDPTWNTSVLDPSVIPLNGGVPFSGESLSIDVIGPDPVLNLLDDFLVTEDDTIVGTSATEWMEAGAGNDTVDLGDGIDTFSFVNMAQGTAASLANGIATIGALTKTLTNVENITGTSLADFIEGDAGNNTLRGLGGTDWFTATAGYDRYDGGAGKDTVSYVNAQWAVRVELDRAQIDANGQFVDRYSSIENVTGSSYADIIEGDAGANVLRGLGGNDVFYGTDGGLDSYRGGAGLDTVDYSNATAGVFAWLKDPSYEPPGAVTDDFVSIERLVGSDFDDILRGDNIVGTREWLLGGAGNDQLLGDSGIDHLSGGTGDDTLNGGAGYDYAMYDGNQDEFSFVTNSNGKTIVTHLDGVWGVDTLVNVQVMRFADGDVMLDAGY